jgi:broad specificity phosphatase PhoE
VDIFAAVTEPKLENVLFVMRHGQTVLDDEHRSDGWLDYPLSDKGRIGLITAQQYLKLAPIKDVYASSLRRVAESAHIVSSGILNDPKPHIDDDLRTWHLGVMIGTKKKPNKSIISWYMTHTDQVPHGGESMDQFRARFLPWVYGKLKKLESGSGPALLVTSGSNLREISYAATGSRDTFDLDEGGLAMLFMHNGKIHGRVLFGHKDADREDFS